MTNTNNIPTVSFHDGNSIPQLGFGVYQVPDEEAHNVVTTALEAGYRHIDTAAIYLNERGVGSAIRESGIPREEIFLTTKLWNGHQGYEATLKAFEDSLQRLGVDYVDLYLMHWPLPKAQLYNDTFKAFLKLKSDGLIRSVGVSNFYQETLADLISTLNYVPVINQIELHPYLTQTALQETHTKYGIITEAWSPLGGGRAPVLEDPTLVRIAQEVGKSPAQVVIRWNIDNGNVVIPKSATPQRIRENINVFDFELSPEQVKAISALNKDLRTGPNPEEFDRENTVPDH